MELPGGVLALLPRMQLSDSYSNVGQVHKLYHEGDAIEQIMVFDRKGKSVVSFLKICVCARICYVFNQSQKRCVNTSQSIHVHKWLALIFDWLLTDYMHCSTTFLCIRMIVNLKSSSAEVHALCMKFCMNLMQLSCHITSV